MNKSSTKKIGEKKTVLEVYNNIFDWFDNNRTKNLEMEKKYLELIVKTIPLNGSILDAGCGSAEPIASYFINKGYQVIGIDNCEAMISLCNQRFPNNEWICMDMKELTLTSLFDCVIAWHSFFHIPEEEQESVLSRLCSHLKKGGLLTFTSGPERAEEWSDNGGEMLFHASLSSENYQNILLQNDMKVILHNTSDPQCGGATVWVAQRLS
jgi:SAM-dependent methyltransferase